MKEKIFKGTIIMNWKTGDMRIIKSKLRKSINPYEVNLPFNIVIKIQEIKDTELSATIDLPMIDVSDVRF